MNETDLVAGLRRLAGDDPPRRSAAEVHRAAGATAVRRRRLRRVGALAAWCLVLAGGGLALYAVSNGPERGAAIETAGPEADAEVAAPAAPSPAIGTDELIATTGAALSGPDPSPARLVVLPTEAGGDVAEAGARASDALADLPPGASDAAFDVTRTKLVYVVADPIPDETPNGGRVFTYDIATSTSEELTALEGSSAPQWSPSGNEVVAVHSGALVVLDLSTDQTRTLPIAFPHAASWSPDGSRLAVSHGDPVAISLIGADGSGLTPFAPIGTEQWGPSWSPDGTRIAFGSSETGSIYTAAADGSEIRQVSACTGTCNEDVEPTWSPDGTSIAFARNVGGRRQLYIVSASGGTETRVTDDGNDYASPSWR